MRHGREAVLRAIVGIAVAGAAGALARYGVGGLVGRYQAGAFPWGTFLVNVAGSFVLGLLFAALTGRMTVSPTTRDALTIGFVGAFTTFSTFSLETFTLLEEGAYGLAAINVLGSLTLGLIAVWGGITIGRAL
ncbi:MAG: fluoride efflux transporter CrcB [Actinomycetota bacterium]